tara:strand:- start:2224 stop:2640 length:417 start_codon:yes stop_codon:yes gene_type:complete
MLEFFQILNSNLISIFLTSFLLGSLIFFASIIAPTVFRTLPEKNARFFIRNIFPKLYLWGIVVSFINSFSLIVLSKIAFYLSVTILLGFLFSRQILMPKINKLSDTKNLKKFQQYHTLSVIIFITQLILMFLIIILIR